MGTNTPKNNRTDQTVADQNLINGLTKHASSIPSLVIGGTTYTTSEIIAKVQPRITSATTVTTTKATWQAAVKSDDAEQAASQSFVSGLRQAILVAFGGQVDVLADFGLTPRKPRVLTPAQKTAAAAKAKATRAARHTMGKVQKSKVTGTSVTAAPGTPTPAPAPPAAPVVAPVATIGTVTAAPVVAPTQTTKA